MAIDLARKAAAALLGAALLACAATHDGEAPALADPDLAGIWQFPNSGAWIQVWPDGQAFQCRTPPSGHPIWSRGTVRGRIVFWDEWWPIDALSVDSGKLVLYESQERRWAFERVSVMPPPCNALSVTP